MKTDAITLIALLILPFTISAQNDKIIRNSFLVVNYSAGSISKIFPPDSYNETGRRKPNIDTTLSISERDSIHFIPGNLPLYHKTIKRDFGTLLTGSQDNEVYNTYASINTDKGEGEVSLVFAINGKTKNNVPTNTEYPVHSGSRPIGLLYLNVKGALADNTIELFSRGNITPQVSGKVGMNWLISARYYYYESEGEKTRRNLQKKALHLNYQCDSSIAAITTLIQKKDKTAEDYYAIFTQYEKYSNGTGVVPSKDLEEFMNPILEGNNTAFDRQSTSALNEFSTLISNFYDSKTSEQTVSIVGSLKNSYREYHWINTEGSFYGESYNAFNPDDPKPTFNEQFFTGGGFKVKYNVHTLHNYKPLKNHYIGVYCSASYTNNRKSLNAYKISNPFIDTVGGASDTLFDIKRDGSSYSTKEVKTSWQLTPGIDWLWYLSVDRSVAINLFTSFNIYLTEKLRPSANNSFDQYVQWNLGGGLVFNIPNKDKTKPAVNMGLFIAVNDLTGPVTPEAPYVQRVNVGLKTALPFVTVSR